MNADIFRGIFIGMLAALPLYANKNTAPNAGYRDVQGVEKQKLMPSYENSFMIYSNKLKAGHCRGQKSGAISLFLSPYLFFYSLVM